MSQFTDYGENRLCDKMRGQTVAYPASWWIAPLSAASDAAFTEITGVGLSRHEAPRDLQEWSGTQGAATILPSSGTSHATSNNDVVSLGTASGSGTLAALGFYDAPSGGNCWMVWRLSSPLAFVSGGGIDFAAGSIAFSLGLVGGMTDYLANRLIDEVFRGVNYSWPLSMRGALFTAPPTNAGGGTEVAGGVGYSRPELPSTLVAVSGTQGPGTTTPSIGTSGLVSNNAPVTFPQPLGSWGTLTHAGWYDAGTGGNLLWWGALGQPTTIGANSSPPSYAAGAAQFSFA